MSRDSIIVKLGGKILENEENLSNTISQFEKLLERKLVQKLIIIPGGGSFANFIRFLDKMINLGDDKSHWMAIYAMNFNGINLCKKYPNFKCISDFKNLKKFREIISVFLPHDYLHETDELPHDWNVSSDSITLYLAKQLNLSECFLIKDVDGILDKQKELIKEITTKDYKIFKNSHNLAQIQDCVEDLKKSRPIDSHLLTLIETYKIPCIILNGNGFNSRILTYFNTKEKDKIYTKISFE